MKFLFATILLMLFCMNAFAQQRPNVLFIIVDDLNDMPLHPEGKPQVPTPNFDRLAARGVSFTNAHCNDPICAPSRSSMLTGLYPQTSSLYWFEDYRANAILSKSVTLTEHLATNGYGVYTVGKIYHGKIDMCGLPKEPHAGRSDYALDGHSIKPLILNPDGKWSGPDVAITSLPGKDHSQHVEHIGTLYPHFSVRARDWRYSLTSDGQEELYRYSSDPHEFTNLADRRDFAEIKAKLRKQLIALRDGNAWEDFKSLPTDELTGFERKHSPKVWTV